MSTSPPSGSRSTRERASGPGRGSVPEAIRSLSSLLRPFHPAYGVDLFETLGVVDYGDVPVAPGDTPGSLRRIEEGLAPLVEASVTTLGLGGDHTITLAELRAHAKRHGPLALVQLDAHADTWDEYFGMKETHGTTFRRAAEEGLLDTTASVQAGMRGSLYRPGDYDLSRDLGFTLVTADELRALGPAGYGELVRGKVGDRPVFVSFDVDFLDPAYAPGTGTPEVGGFSTGEAVAYLRALRGIRLAAADVVEVSPAYDGPGQITALAAANVALGAPGVAGRRVSWLGDSAAIACLTFDVDAESAILVHGRRTPTNASVMTHQAYGPQRRRAADPRACSRTTACRRRSSSRASPPTATRRRSS